MAIPCQSNGDNKDGVPDPDDMYCENIKPDADCSGITIPESGRSVARAPAPAARSTKRVSAKAILGSRKGFAERC